MRDLTYPPIIMMAKAGFKALNIRFQMTGLEHAPREGGAVLAINHISYVDFILAGYGLQPAGRLVRFMAKKELFDHTVSGPIMRSLHHIDVDRAAGMASYRKALSYLKDGEIVGIFPEATISRSFELKEFKSGATRLAATSKVPVIPMVLWGTQRIYTKGHPRDLSRGKTIAITIGEPLYPTSRDHEQVHVELQRRMASMLDESIRAYPEMPPGAWWLPKRYGGSAPTLEEAAALDEAELQERAARKAAEAALEAS